MSIQDPSAAEVETYQAATKAIYDEYGPKVLALMNGWAEALRAAGIPTDEPTDMSADDYTWNVLASPAGKNRVGIDVELAESLGYEGTTEGIGWHVRLIEDGGRLLGEFAYANYTPDVWVAVDSRAVKVRFQMLRELSTAELINRVLEAEAPSERVA